jgi:hypothetical protein
VKDKFGIPVDVGDIIVSAAGSTGRLKVGKVYRFDKNGNPWIIHEELKYNVDSGKYEPGWTKSEAGAGVIVIGYPSGDIPKTVTHLIHQDYPE